MFRRILVGCDGSPQSRDGLALGSQLAEATGATLMLGYVFDQQPQWFGSQATYQRARRTEIRAIFDPALKTLPDSLEVETVAVGSASTARGLHDLAEGERAGLVVLGSTHRGSVGRVLPGSVAEVLLAAAPCALAIAPHGYGERDPAPSGVVGVGFDGSPEAERAVRSADGLAKSLGASLRVIAVAEHHWFDRGHATVQHPLEERLAHVLEALGRPASDGLTLAGEPAAVLAEASGDLDLLVAGSRGYGPMHHLLVGSVSARLMRRAACPVMLLARSAPSPERDVAEPGAAAQS